MFVPLQNNLLDYDTRLIFFPLTLFSCLLISDLKSVHEELVDNNDSTCVKASGSSFEIDTEIFAELPNPMKITILQQDENSCTDLMLFYTKSNDTDCKSYKQCELLAHSSDKECRFQCNCKINKCYHTLYSEIRPDTLICDIKVFM